MTEHTPPVSQPGSEPAGVKSGPVVGIPTQVAHPWKAVARTIVATVLGLVLSGGLIALAEFLVELTTGTGFEAHSAAFLGFATVLTGALTRLLASPAVQPIAERIGLGTGVEQERAARV